MALVTVDVFGLTKFFERVGAAGRGDLRRELELYVEGLGNEFLRVVQDEIIRRKVMDTRLLLASFHKGDGNNIWELADGNLTLEVGSSLEYAGYVNDGHYTNPQGVAIRFVPGHWEGHRFIYDPSAKGGMVLKQHWVKGEPYFDSALRIIEKMYPKLLEAKLQQWLESYFGAT